MHTKPQNNIFVASPGSALKKKEIWAKTKHTSHLARRQAPQPTPQQGGGHWCGGPHPGCLANARGHWATAAGPDTGLAAPAALAADSPLSSSKNERDRDREEKGRVGPIAKLGRRCNSLVQVGHFAPYSSETASKTKTYTRQR